MKTIITCTVIFFAFTAQAKLLDKIAAVINEKTYTLNEIKDIKNSISARKEIASFVYTKKTYSLNDVFYHLRNRFIISDKLAETGIVVTDERVEDQINATKKRLGIDEATLIKSLRDRGLSFDQYFELTKEITEYNQFNRNVIAPLVNITDQEVKNYYYQKSNNKQSFTFEYNIVDYTIPESKLSKKSFKKLNVLLKKYKKNSILPGELKGLEVNDLGKISDDDLPAKIGNVLRKSLVNSFSEPVLIDGTYHVFFLKKKELSESSQFKAVKNQIYSQIYLERSKEITESWFNREALNYYILKNI